MSAQPVTRINNNEATNTTTLEDVCRAAELGDSEMIERALRGLPEQDRTRLISGTFDGATPLHAAVDSGNVDAVRVLTEAGADPNAEIGEGRTPLYYLVTSLVDRRSRVDMMKLLLDAGANPYVTNIFHLSAQRGCVEEVKLLLENGVDAGVVDEYEGVTPLHHAFLYSGEQSNQDVAELLLGAGADPNAQDEEGVTPFHRASKCSSVEVVNLMWEKGADMGVDDDNGWTVLHWAANENDNAAVAMWLLDNGAGALLNATDFWKRTPLHFAARDGCLDVVRCLLARDGVDLEAKDTRGRTPLHLAAMKGRLSVIPLLVDKGADLEATDSRGSTPLHSACHQEGRLDLVPRRLDLVQALVDRGANIFAKNNDGDTPLDRAVENGRDDVISFLLERYVESIIEQVGDLCLHTVLRQAIYVDEEADEDTVMAVLPVGSLPVRELVILLENVMYSFPEYIGARDSRGALALHLACSSACPVPVVRVLVEKDADSIRAQDNNGATPLHLACHKPLHAACNVGLDREKIKFLVEEGGSGTLRALNNHGVLPLHVLCASDPEVEVVEYFVQEYAEALYRKTSQGDLPMMVAWEQSASLSVIYALMQAQPGALMDVKEKIADCTSP